ncbi:translation factor GUF1, mitochondrial isoform X3 [Elephas maximus indicus]|uniref:translation factor GUF1, mitochondrial isoform X3 n=1 Tax=Elephas maximus indicus TaxID=99487 RepID=UPI0021169545|nr:translation factor GUF1, mitochondrial isoform X3 [Elephas maximus indicus]
MWLLAGRGPRCGRALVPWASGAACLGLPWLRCPATRGSTAEPWAPARLYGSGDRKEKIDMSRFPAENIRNFSVIAHVDHGKSTLADRLLELTGTIDKTKNNKQVLDKLQVERERGITVKAQTASLFYNCEGKQYLLNLIDTPGHVDFSYEVSRSLSACQGVLLVVDANEGIQAQTVANFFLAFEAQLSVIPVINKIDLKNADPERVEKQIEKAFDIPSDECIKISAKLGTNVESVLQAVIERIPPYAGQVGYLIAGMKDVTEAQIGDTLYLHKQPVEPLPGFKSAKPMVFAGMYPIDQSEYNNLKSAIEKLTLNDSSVTVYRDSSLALGAGWRLGFLGLLHMEVFNQRLEQEYNASVILTTPTVPYKAVLSSAKLIKEYREKEITIINPAQFPEKSKVTEYLEPVVLGTVITPDEYTGKIMMLCQARRGVQKNMMYIDQHRVMLKYLFPLNEIVVDFYDSLKSLSSGYASFDYEDAGYQTAELVKMDILLNGNIVEELVTVVHKDKAHSVGKVICERLKDSLPRQLFEIAIQAAIGSKIIARETVKAYRKNVLAKCYGGDITRKMKLLKRQAEGKKKLRKVGNIEVPKDAFIKVLKTQPDK